MNVKLYKIKCLTNLHVGNGDVNFSIIDNEVERDPVNKYPTINASGVKGALRQHFTELSDVDDSMIVKLFGKSNEKAKDENGRVINEAQNEDALGGNLKMFSANMLSIPMRVSNGDEPYAMVTTDKAIEGLKSLVKALLCKDLTIVEGDIPQDFWIEDVRPERKIKICDEEAFVMKSKDFKNIPLPVVARNCLVKDKQNLWYEEIVPHESVFYFFVASIDNSVDDFAEIINKDNNKIVQFGGKASIGFGFCELEEVSFGE